MNYDPRYPTSQGGDSKDVSNINITVSEKPYSLGTSYLLLAMSVFGLSGLHRFYLGKVWSGLFFLLTLGFLGIGTLVDLFSLKSMVRDANRRDGYIAPRRFQLEPQKQVASLAGQAPGNKVADLRVALLNAARRNGGVLTVTQGVIASGRAFEEVERALNAMVDKGYVDVDNAPESGVVIYRFPDLIGG
ncbi:MAG: TM2 domain-containing protein [Gemmatimonadetes bacterium]|nr:TM2 domain-containing protein [Gemmatimonadota bacterium]